MLPNNIYKVNFVPLSDKRWCEQYGNVTFNDLTVGFTDLLQVFQASELMCVSIDNSDNTYLLAPTDDPDLQIWFPMDAIESFTLVRASDRKLLNVDTLDHSVIYDENNSTFQVGCEVISDNDAIKIATFICNCLDVEIS